VKTSSRSPPPHRLLEDGIERRRRQRARWEHEGERPLAQNLAMIGSLGWLIVVPTLVSLFVGRWLTFTAAFLFAGIAVGSWLAWQRMHRG
jgi:ATP synthase protein I